jgi:hypothetical protein
MKAYVQYLALSPITGKFYEPCGDRAVFILDGRNSLQTWINDAREANGFRRPNYPAFKIMLGDFRESKEIYSTI